MVAGIHKSETGKTQSSNVQLEAWFETLNNLRGYVESPILNPVLRTGDVMSDSAEIQNNAGDVDAKPGRRFLRPRFGLKSLLAVATLVALFFGFFYPFVRRQQMEREAIVKLNSLASDESQFFYDYQNEDEPSEPTTPKWIRRLFGDNIFSTVTRINLVDGYSIPEGKFEDVSKSLAKFHNVEELTVDGWREETNADFFARYPGMKKLSLNNWSNLTDISGLRGMSELESLSFFSTKVGSIEPIAECVHLKHLDLSYGAVADVGLLAEMKELNSLSCILCKHVESLDFLAELQNLENLLIGASDNVRTFDFALIAKNTNLKFLRIVGFDSIKNLDLLSEFHELQSMQIFGCGIKRIPSLNSLKKLHGLSFESCSSLTDIESLGALPALSHVSIYDCDDIRGIEMLTQCKRLDSLSVAGCENIKSFQPVAEMDSLKTLRIESESITNLDFLKGTRFFSCELRNCSQLSDLSALADFEDADVGCSVTLQNCPQVSPEHVDEIREKSVLSINAW